MENQISFSTLGNECVHKFRDKINNAENIVDLRNQFTFTVIDFLNQIFENSPLDIDADDIKFNPDIEDLYILSNRLTNDLEFKKIWDISDLKNVIRKFADSANNRYIHINKHNEKTNKKIRN
ncbi:MAG: hypothetical protein P9M11_01160 [Candidatus Tenebribacter burtonii]|jgi:ADP-heptose:LPS heptosyltransferase|nr:hypothetical protein [Candidatus Tenebribacter burtonii]